MTISWVPQKSIDMIYMPDGHRFYLKVPYSRCILDNPLWIHDVDKYWHTQERIWEIYSGDLEVVEWLVKRCFDVNLS